MIRRRLVLAGVGAVGGTLLRQLDAARAHAARRGIALEVAALLRRDRARLGEVPRPCRAVPRDGWEDVADPMAVLDHLTADGGEDLILLDATAGDTHPLWVAVLDRGGAVASANKLPLASTQARWDKLHASAGGGRRLRYEATVGAGLPVLGPLAALLATGDEVRSIEGALSGTLGVLATALQDGVPLSGAIREARDAGFTEPDPREDLSGADVARKALILARVTGRELEPEDVDLEPFVETGDPGASVEDFLGGVAAHDGAFADRAARVAAADLRLRFVAEVRPGRVRAGLAEVDLDSPLAGLRGPENLVRVVTRRYDPDALVIRGPGAGADRTAAGLLGDALALAEGAGGTRT